MRSPWFVGDFPVTQGYKPGPGTFDPGHTGIDIGLPQGTPLVVPVPATVTDRENPGGFGHYQTVVPDAAPNTTFILGHESLWDVGSGHYPGGTRVAESGATGRATGPHLHFEQDTGGPPYAAGNESDPSQALSGSLPYMQNAQTVAPSAAPTNPYGALDPRAAVWEVQRWMNDVFSPEHLVRGALVVGGILVLIVGLFLLARTAVIAPMQAQEQETAA